MALMINPTRKLTKQNTTTQNSKLDQAAESREQRSTSLGNHRQGLTHLEMHCQKT